MIDIAYLLQFLWVRNSESVWLGGSPLVSHEFVAKILVKTAVIWSLDWAGRCVSKVSHSYDQQVGSFPHGHLHGTAWVSPQYGGWLFSEQVIQEAKPEMSVPLMTASEAKHSDFRYILSVSQLSPDLAWEGTIPRRGHQEAGILVDCPGGWLSQLGRKMCHHWENAMMELYLRELLVAAWSCQERRRQSLNSFLKEKNFGLVCEERECPGQNKTQEERKAQRQEWAEYTL